MRSQTRGKSRCIPRIMCVAVACKQASGRRGEVGEPRTAADRQDPNGTERLPVEGTQPAFLGCRDIDETVLRVDHRHASAGASAHPALNSTGAQVDHVDTPYADCEQPVVLLINDQVPNTPAAWLQLAAQRQPLEIDLVNRGARQPASNEQ